MTEGNTAESAKSKSGCYPALLLAILVCAFPFWWLKLQTVVNQLKWQNSGIVNYQINVIPIGMATWPELGIDDSPLPVGKARPNNIKVEDLFKVAYQCVIFCNVRFDPKYGYPNHIEYFFLEGGWLDISVIPK